MRWLQFIFSHSLFISFCAAAMCVQTYILTGLTIDYKVCWFVFFSTLASYNFYWLVSKYAFRRNSLTAAFLTAELSYLLLFIVAGFGSLLYALQLPHLWGWISIGALLTLLYSLPLWPFHFVQKTPKPGFLKTVLLAFTWAYVITVLPLGLSSGVDWVEFSLLFTTRFFFMLMLCSIFDMRDAAIDQLHALKTLATSVSPKALQRIMAVTFSLYILAGIAMRWYFSNSAQMAAFTITAAILWWVYRLSLRKQGYLFYYFGVDGLMLFSSIATIVAHWL